MASTLSISKSTYKHRLPTLISRRKADAVRPREQNTQVDKLNLQEVASGGGSAASLVMTMTLTIIGQHPQIITCRMRTVCQGGQCCDSGALCVGK
jgi:hypothetical protein